jgi:CheY-like chemotaxis protein
VLLVEDNPEVAEVSCEMLEELGYAVKLARDAEAALSIVAGESFDLVVSDIVMAGALDGVGLARALRESHPALPVILVSGYSNAASLADAEFTVLRKPYKLADLSRAAAKTIAEARQPPPHNLINLRDVRRPPKPERA